jgi:dihydrofolate reductase
MKTILIAAMASNRVIGNKGQIPWMGQFPEDMKHFKETTTGNAVVMGRKTYESIGKPLVMRSNIVVSRTMRDPALPLLTVRDSLEGALNHCRREGRSFCYIIGGADIYRQALPFADHIYLTRIHKEFEGDTYFPAIDRNQFEMSVGFVHENEHFGYTFEHWDRV